MIVENISFLTLGITISFFASLTFSLIKKRNRSRLQSILMFVLGIWTVFMAKDALYILPVVKTNLYIQHVILSFDLLCVQLCAFLLLEITMPGYIRGAKLATLFTPSIIFLLTVIFLYSERVFELFTLYSLIFGCCIGIRVIYSAFKYKRFIKNNFSYTEDLSVEWLINVTLALAICLLTSVLNMNELTPISDIIYYIVSSLIWGFVYHYSSNHITIASVCKYGMFNYDLELKLSDDIQQCPESQKSRFVYRDLDSRLIKTIKDERLYLDPKLSVEKVAQKLSTNRTYLSQYLNSKLNTTFYEFINKYRVEAASNLLLENRKATLEQVSEECGFNSVSTFRRAFSKTHNMTPAQYRDLN